MHQQGFGRRERRDVRLGMNASVRSPSLCAVRSRSGQPERRKHPVEIGEVPARHERDGAAEAQAGVRQRGDCTNRDLDRRRGCSYLDDRAVDIQEQSPVVAPRW